MAAPPKSRRGKLERTGPLRGLTACASPLQSLYLFNSPGNRHLRNGTAAEGRKPGCVERGQMKRWDQVPRSVSTVGEDVKVLERKVLKSWNTGLPLPGRNGFARFLGPSVCAAGARALGWVRLRSEPRLDSGPKNLDIVFVFALLTCTQEHSSYTAYASKSTRSQRYVDRYGVARHTSGLRLRQPVVPSGIGGGTLAGWPLVDTWVVAVSRGYAVRPITTKGWTQSN